MGNFRKLRAEEIEKMLSQSCFCENWDDVSVGEKFNAEFCRNVWFSGKVKIGETGKKNTNRVMFYHSGIYYARIHNCVIGDNVYIYNIGTHIANYEIGDDTVIENTDTIEVNKKNAFGNGIKISVMNEMGGREITIFKGMSAQFAYMTVFYRHDKHLLSQMEKIAEDIRISHESDTGKIGKNVKISNAGTITCCNIGDFAQILAAARLHCGSVESSKDAPVRIGTGVIADHFLIHEGSSILDRATVSHCFIGEGCDLAREFSTEHSLFFANFIGHHGEAYSVFAGPHTVTHHKSTLLIAGYFLFHNAGSGSNQSNHMYKMGPLHQGVFERGTKMGSDSYVLYPARVGPFNLILGRHTNHCDTKDMPYSYLIEQANQSVLIPGTNIKKVGTIRDADKWKSRDKRKGKSLDIVNYDLLNPFTVSKMFRGKDVLYDLKIRNVTEFVNGFDEQVYKFNGAIIPKTALSNGINYYKLGIVKYLGNVFVDKLLGSEINSKDDLQSFLHSKKFDCNEWFDIAGCVLPKNKIENFIEKMDGGEIDSLEKFDRAFKEMSEKYSKYSWQWCVFGIEKYYEKPMKTMNKDDLTAFLDEWITATKKLDEWFLNDANSEYSQKMRIGFGIDGNQDTANDDFDEVRGEFNKNEFVEKINLHLKRKTQLYEKAIETIKKFAKDEANL
ncbi:MAG: DUF4954 family protein [Chitinivibrionia bacterium]|nr:DUF4954 family protein [Chitinivibrionia bacterium]